MLTVIPFFREIVISAFECPHCGFRNTGIQSAAQISERGVTYEVLTKDRKVDFTCNYCCNINLGTFATDR